MGFSEQNDVQVDNMSNSEHQEQSQERIVSQNDDQQEQQNQVFQQEMIKSRSPSSFQSRESE